MITNINDSIIYIKIFIFIFPITLYCPVKRFVGQTLSRN